MLEKKDHGEVEEQLKRWFLEQPQYKGWYLLKNETGWDDKKKAHCGFPESGGGTDYIALGGDAETQFFEVKTDGYPTLSKKQKIFARNMTSKGFKCWVFRGHWGRCYLIPAGEYKPTIKTVDVQDYLVSPHQDVDNSASIQEFSSTCLI